jgi:hypothetical protein
MIQLTESMGQGVVVETGRRRQDLGAVAVKNAKPDGYTLTWATWHAALTCTCKKLDYDPVVISCRRSCHSPVFWWCLRVGTTVEI